MNYQEAKKLFDLQRSNAIDMRVNPTLYRGVLRAILDTQSDTDTLVYAANAWTDMEFERQKGEQT